MLYSYYRQSSCSDILSVIKPWTFPLMKFRVLRTTPSSFFSTHPPCCEPSTKFSWSVRPLATWKMVHSPCRTPAYVGPSPTAGKAAVSGLPGRGARRLQRIRRKAIALRLPCTNPAISAQAHLRQSRPPRPSVYKERAPPAGRQFRILLSPATGYA